MYSSASITHTQHHTVMFPPSETVVNDTRYSSPVPIYLLLPSRDIAEWQYLPVYLLLAASRSIVEKLHITSQCSCNYRLEMALITEMCRFYFKIVAVTVLACYICLYIAIMAGISTDEPNAPTVNSINGTTQAMAVVHVIHLDFCSFTTVWLVLKYNIETKQFKDSEQYWTCFSFSCELFQKWCRIHKALNLMFLFG